MVISENLNSKLVQNFSLAKFILLHLESLSSKYAKLHTVAASTDRDHMARSLHYCLFTPHIYIYIYIYVC